MSLFNNVNTGNLEIKETDSLGSNYNVLDTDVYDMVIEKAYIDETQYGSLFLDLSLKDENSGETFNPRIYFTDRQKNTFSIGKQDKKKYPNRGFLMVNSIAFATLGKDFLELDLQSRPVKVYDRESRSMVDLNKDVPVALLNTKLKVALLKCIKDKDILNSEGKYVPTGETKELNEISKVFNYTSGMTSTETKANAEKPEFIYKWLDKFKGEVSDTATRKRDPSLPPSMEAYSGKETVTPTTTSSLFDD